MQPLVVDPRVAAVLAEFGWEEGPDYVISPDLPDEPDEGNRA